MKLKYSVELSTFKCDLSLFKEEQREAYRWVFEDVKDYRNFTPVYILDKFRSRITCKGFALSFYEQHVNAKARLLHLTTDKEFLFKKLGTHIAVGIIDKKDGVSEPADNDTHFNHFEYEDVVFSDKFQIIEKVVK